MGAICCTLPSKYLRSFTITLSHKPSALRSRTSEGFTTVNSPDRFDFTNRFWYAGSMDWDTPTMLEMVAVGAMAMTLLLRMPCLAISSRIGVESRQLAVFRHRSPSLLASFQRAMESMGPSPSWHREP